MLSLEWMRYDTVSWCRLESLTLADPYFDRMEGVYIIWRDSCLDPTTIRVGQGIIRDRLADHRKDPQIQAYIQKVQAYTQNELFVTWASVAREHRDGVEVYLANALGPRVGAVSPYAQPIEVNLPW
jgi:hypothetical protein